MGYCNKYALMITYRQMIREVHEMNLTNKQLEEIKELSNTVVEKRKYLLINLCEILGDEWYVAQFGRTNSQCLINEKTYEEVHVTTYHFTNPSSYAIKYIYDGVKSYAFDEYGNLTK